MFILNIAAGKVLPLQKLLPGDFLVNLDLEYLNPIATSHVEELHRQRSSESYKYNIHYCNHDVYNFLERYTEQFDMVVMYRFLEHVPKVKLLYFIYMLSTIIKIGGRVEIIVPDYKLLAQRILEENPFGSNFESEDIITTFELLNEDYSPHLSIWTKDRAKYFFELEGRFKVIEVNEYYPFDGREIYLRFVVERVK